MKRIMLLAAFVLLLSGCGKAVDSSATTHPPSSEAAGGALPESTPASTLLEPGAGGDAAWWETHLQDAKTADEKTAAGFVSAVLKRDIGAGAEKPAGIDTYFEPDKLEAKQKLAIYDISSPQVREIHFESSAKDETGTLYTFKLSGGTSTDAFEGFEGSLKIHVLGSSHLVDDVAEATFDAKKN